MAHKEIEQRRSNLRFKLAVPLIIALGFVGSTVACYEEPTMAGKETIQPGNSFSVPDNSIIVGEVIVVTRHYQDAIIYRKEATRLYDDNPKTGEVVVVLNRAGIHSFRAGPNGVTVDRALPKTIMDKTIGDKIAAIEESDPNIQSVNITVIDGGVNSRHAGRMENGKLVWDKQKSAK